MPNTPPLEPAPSSVALKGVTSGVLERLSSLLAAPYPALIAPYAPVQLWAIAVSLLWAEGAPPSPKR